MPTPRSLHRPAALLLSFVAAVALARACAPSTPDPWRASAEREARLHVDAGPTALDPNTATARALESLPGIGPALASRIVAERLRGRVFRRPEDLLHVRGIGPRTLDRIAPGLFFDAGATDPR